MANPDFFLNIFRRITLNVLQTHGDDVDDEEFTIQIKFDIFAFPEVDPRISMEKVEAAAQASCKQGEESLQGPR